MRLRSLFRGIQSAVFYYLSCAPWFKYLKKRRRAKQRRRNIEQPETVDIEASNAYTQPPAFRTNPYWAEEIRLGPGPPSRRLTKKQRIARQRLKQLDSDARIPVASETSLGGDGSIEVNLKNSTAPVPEGERWKLLQRRDEPLWGCEELSPSSVSWLSNRNTHATLAGYRTYDRNGNASGSPIVAVNPPISDLHPPVVSNPALGNTSNMWMLQPPPPAAVMSGRVAPSRGHSTTASSQSSHRAPSRRFGRKLSRRILDERMRRGDMLYPDTSGTVSMLSGSLDASSIDDGIALFGRPEDDQGEQLEPDWELALPPRPLARSATVPESLALAPGLLAESQHGTSQEVTIRTKSQAPTSNVDGFGRRISHQKRKILSAFLEDEPYTKRTRRRSVDF